MTENKLRIAAVGDLHGHEASAGLHREFFESVGKNADILLLCGDLSNHGLPIEAENLAHDLSGISIPVLGVLGNHDFESGNMEEFKKILTQAGVKFLEDKPFEVGEVGFAGVKGNWDPQLFIAMLGGLSLVIASACVINNVFDRDIDSKMERTKNRAIVTGTISKTKALIFGAVLLLVGVTMLFLHTTYYTLLAGVLAWLVYVAIYTPLKKQNHARDTNWLYSWCPASSGWISLGD